MPAVCNSNSTTPMRYYQQSIPESVKEAAQVLEKDLGCNELYGNRTVKKKKARGK
jgi:hypothetical protein